tara:strand:+ start:2050 stop:2250 length:201 start_codon:yes stop_codon:yes gene_type:complete
VALVHTEESLWVLVVVWKETVVRMVEMVDQVEEVVVMVSVVKEVESWGLVEKMVGRAVETEDVAVI